MHSRKKTLETLASTRFDLLVIGGGATGAGIALDASLRGLSVALIEKRDYASGTSSRSTKLLHGGVRYLEHAFKHLDRGSYQLVQDALQERSTLLKIAPHWTRWLTLLMPISSWWRLPYYWAGLKTYDALAGRGTHEASGFCNIKQTLEHFPYLDPKKWIGALHFVDGQFDDARMNLGLILTAESLGAVCSNYLKAESFVIEKNKIRKTLARDEITGEEIAIEAKKVINASGPWTDLIRQKSLATSTRKINTSIGSHLVLSKKWKAPSHGLILPKTSDNRVLFVLPWHEQILIGTTDSPHPLSDNPSPSKEEIDFIQNQLKEATTLNLQEEDISASWSGLRPLINEEDSKTTAEISRDHWIEEGPHGLVSVAGGKWTTYRLMASEALEKAFASIHLPECATDQYPLVGGNNWHPMQYTQYLSQYPISEVSAKHLHQNYGTRAQEVLKIAKENKNFNLLMENEPYLEAEVLYASICEHALKPEDFLERRIRLGFLDSFSAKKIIHKISELLKSAQEDL